MNRKHSQLLCAGRWQQLESPANTYQQRKARWLKVNPGSKSIKNVFFYSYFLFLNLFNSICLQVGKEIVPVIYRSTGSQPAALPRQYLIYFHKLTLRNQSIQDIIKNWVCLLPGSHEYIFRFAYEITVSYLFNLCSLDNIDRI